MDVATLGERELDVMTWLWANESGTVTEVKDGVAEDEGRAHRYFPRVKQKSAQRRALRRLIDTLFLGSPEALLTHLVDDHDLSPAELRRIAKRLSEKDSGERGGT